MKKIFGLLIVGMAIMQCAVAQDSEKTGFDKSKLFFGGNLGLAFGTYTIVNISPQVGYHFSPMFAGGVGVNYSYFKYDNGILNSKQSYAGMNIFGRVHLIQQFFIQVQPEANYIWGSQTADGYTQDAPFYKIPTQFVPSLLLGGGAAVPAGRGAIVISILYDVIQNQWSPYFHQALYGFGYNIGF